MTPHRRAPRGPLWVVGEPSARGTVHLPGHSLPGMPIFVFGVPGARGYCSPPRALSPENAYPCTNLRGTESPGAATCNPEHSLPSTFAQIFRGTKSPGAATSSPEHSLPSTFTLTLGEPCARGLLRAVLEHSLLELSSTDRRGTRVLGGDRAPPRALSSRYLALLIVGGLGCSGVTGHLPEHLLPGTLGSVDYRGTGVLGNH